MAKIDYYTFLSDPQDSEHFICHVVDVDYEPVKRYDINGSACDCWAGQKWCRHKQMLVLFKKEKLVDSRKYFNFDKKTWLTPPKGSE